MQLHLLSQNLRHLNCLQCLQIRCIFSSDRNVWDPLSDSSSVRSTVLSCFGSYKPCLSYRRCSAILILFSQGIELPQAYLSASVFVRIIISIRFCHQTSVRSRICDGKSDISQDSSVFDQLDVYTVPAFEYYLACLPKSRSSRIRTASKESVSIAFLNFTLQTPSPRHSLSLQHTISGILNEG